MQFGDAVTIIAVTYNSAGHIEAFLNSVRAQTYQNYELLLIDSASNDNTCDVVRSVAPWATLAQLTENLGYRRANTVGFTMCSTPLILICNDDVVLEADCVSELVRCMADNPSAAMTCPLITSSDDPELVNTVGNRLSITGFYSARGKARSTAEFSAPCELPSVSGCCFLYRREVYLKVGGFSKDFDGFGPAWHASYEDVDLSYRVRSAGYSILFHPTAVLHHKYVQKAMNIGRFASMIFGRAMLVLRNFELKTIVRLSPLYVLCELALLCYACSKGTGFLAELVRTWIWILGHASEITKMRRKIQAGRRVSDKELFSLLDTMFEVTPAADPRMVVQTGARVVEWMCRTYRYAAFATSSAR